MASIYNDPPAIPYAHLVSNHPCTLAMHRATGRPWQSFAVVLEALTRGMESGASSPVSG